LTEIPTTVAAAQIQAQQAGAPLATPPDVLGQQALAAGASVTEVDPVEMLRQIQALQKAVNDLNAEKAAAGVAPVQLYAAAVAGHLKAKQDATGVDYSDGLALAADLGDIVKRSGESGIGEKISELGGELAKWVRKQDAKLPGIDHGALIGLLEEDIPRVLEAV
jgi:hypothetical protein